MPSAETLKKILMTRYHCESYAKLCQRVPTFAPLGYRDKVRIAMEEKRFCPAGNTLLAGFSPIRPNCSILPTVTDDNFQETIVRATNLWRHHTGIGFDLSGCKYPTLALHCLQKAYNEITFTDRCQRGNMAVVKASHPEALEFVKSKGVVSEANKLHGFNISLAIESEEEGQRLFNKAAKRQGLLWEAAKAAWSTGCPGLVFLHRFWQSDMERELTRLQPCLAPISTTVPCGEQGMRQDESCNLGVINLASEFMYDLDESTDISEDILRDTVRNAVRFLDGIVDHLEIDDPLMLERTRQLRRVGLGITGLADALEKAGYPYDSEEGRQYAKGIAEIINEEADATSRQLAVELGPCLPGSLRRNVTVTCAQPTGNITLLLGCRGFGIEPLMEQATQIHWRDHLAMQIVWQSVFENAISKTVNLPKDATRNDVLGAMQAAFDSNVIKGLAIYRMGSRDEAPFNCNSGENGSCNL